MQLNRKTFAGVVALTFLAVASPSVAQSSGASAAPSDMTAAIAGLPTCFTACATTAATSSEVGCKGLTDLPCLCAKPAFANATQMCIASSGDNDCPKLKTNQTALATANGLFTQLCTAVSGAAAGAGGMSSNSSAMAGMGKPAATTNATAHTNATSSAKPNSAHVVAPPAQHILGATAVVMSVLLGGAIALL